MSEPRPRPTHTVTAQPEHIRVISELYKSLASTGAYSPLRQNETAMRDAYKLLQEYERAARMPKFEDEAPQPSAQAVPDCLTCNDHGAVGNILTAEPCPDCTSAPQPEADEAMRKDAELYRWLRDDAFMFVEHGGIAPCVTKGQTGTVLHGERLDAAIEAAKAAAGAKP